LQQKDLTREAGATHGSIVASATYARPPGRSVR
jgi:hypothetical protein